MANVGLPSYLYKNTTGKTSIVLTSSQSSSTNFEPFICPQQNSPSANATFSMFYSFEYDGSANPLRVTNYQNSNSRPEGYVSMNFDSTRGTLCCNPYNSFRLVKDDGIVVAYDANSSFNVANNGIPVLVSVFVLEI